MLRMVIIFFGALSIIKCQECIQSSTLNFKECDLALDADDQSCSETGLSSGSWWKVDFDGPKMISRFEVKGELGLFEVRVGNNSDTIGRRAGFETNHLCKFSGERELKIRDGFIMFYCDFPIHGKYFSMQHVDPCSPKVLSICNIKFF